MLLRFYLMVILMFFVGKTVTQGRKSQNEPVIREENEPSTSLQAEHLNANDEYVPNRPYYPESGSSSDDDSQENVCYFHKKRISPLEQQNRAPSSEVSTNCLGDLIKMQDIIESSEKYCNLYDSPNPLSLVLCRGAGRCNLDFEDPNVVSKWSRRFICESHKDELLDKWHHKIYKHIVVKQHKLVRREFCSVSGVLGFNHEPEQAPVIKKSASFKLNQQEAYAILKNNHVLLHPGIPLCIEHKKYAKDALSQINSEERGYMLSPRPEENGRLSDSADADDESYHSTRLEYSDPEFKVRSAPKKERHYVPENIKQAFYQFATAAGQTRFISNKPFPDLRPATQRKKSAVLRYLLKTMSEIIAPESPNELRIMALGMDSKQLWQISSDHALAGVLDYTATLYYQADSRTERLHLISVFSPFLSLSHLHQYIPGLSKVMYYQSKKMSRKELVQITTRREKYDPVKVHCFLEFITSNTVTSAHTFGVKKSKMSDGTIMELPNTIRKQGATEVIWMYKNYLKEHDIEDYKMSDSTYFRILSACPATKQTGAVCVDYFLADMLEAQDKIREVLTQWHNTGDIETIYRDQLIRGIDESVNYFKTDYRIHLSSSSETADHCMKYSLSDIVKPEFKAQCDHDHLVKCDRCEMVKNVQGELLDYAQTLVKNNDENDQTAIDQYQEQYAIIKESLTKLFEFKRHVLRSKYTDDHRSDIVENLEEDQALITLDFAQKLLPQKFYETQLDYFAKRGMSYHISHVMANVSSNLVTHSFIHILKDSAQDNQIVTALITHVLTELSSLGIKSVTLRSDNAGCYHSAKTMLSLSTIMEKTGVTISRYSFSEPQNGKGSCDRVASQVKRQVRQYIDLRNDVETEEQFFNALSVRPLKGTSIYLTDLNDRDKGKKTSRTIDGMSGLYDFEIFPLHLVARRYFGIGDGIVVTINANDANKASLSIIESGGFTARKTNEINEKLSLERIPNREPSFWRVGYTLNKYMFSSRSYKEDVVQKDEFEYQEDDKPNKVFRCPVAGCSARFLYHGSLVNHLDRGKHNLSPERRTLRDEALHTFALHLEDLMTPVDVRIEVVSNALQNMRKHKNDKLENLPMGWALRLRTKQGRFSKAAHEWLKNIFEEGLIGRKKSGREVEQMMKTAVNEDGNKKFSVEERLNWRQINNVFVQLNRKQPVTDSGTNVRGKRQSDEKNQDPEEVVNEHSVYFEESACKDSGPSFADIVWMTIRKDNSIFCMNENECAKESTDDNTESDNFKRRSHSPVASSSSSKRIRDELF